MEFIIADSFQESLAHLRVDEQKAVKVTVFDLQSDITKNIGNTGLSLHRLEKAKDKNFFSARVGSDIRLIVHKLDQSYLLTYVDHHDKAYQWAERRKLEAHIKTGAAQLVEIRETVQEILIPKYVEVEKPAPPKPKLFAGYTDDEILNLGVPPEWLSDVRQADEDTLLTLADHLPSEASESLLELATGGKPVVIKPAPAGANPFEHPDAKRRFRVMSNVEELERALDYPWDKWTIFLHPDQRKLVEGDYGGPARVSGSAGTGKTIVALHRAVFLARKNPDTRVLLTTFSDILANALILKLRRLISNEPHLAERLEVHSIDSIGFRLFKSHLGQTQIAPRDKLTDYLNAASSEISGHKFTLSFLQMEWDQVVDAWHLETWESYRDVTRLGRKTRLSEKQRLVLWSIFEKVRKSLAKDNLITNYGMFTSLAHLISESKNPPFDYAVVDESQDIGVAHLRFLAALGGNRPNSLFFAGDLGQRIFQQPFSWKALGVDVRGRSQTLNVNYRTSHQIRMQADLLLAPEVTDADGNVEERNSTISLFNGPAPTIIVFENPDNENKTVGAWIENLVKQGLMPGEIGVFVRSDQEIERAISTVKDLKIAYKVLDGNVETTSGILSICSMHLAKGLEFKAVAVMACDGKVIPSQTRIETIADEADLEDVYNTERHLLYVACTRARDHLLITGVSPASEFLEDLQPKVKNG